MPQDTQNQPRCSYCDATFETAEDALRHEQEAHGGVVSPAEEKMAETIPDGRSEDQDQADILAGLGDAEDPPGEDESTDPLQREVHRPPTPGRSNLQ